MRNRTEIPWQLTGPRWHRVVLYGTFAWITLGPIALLIAYLGWWMPR